MPQGISLHIGVNVVDPSHYGSDARLYGCENDATAMKQIADTQGYRSTLLLSQEATTRNLINAIKQAAANLQAGDIFFFSYSGHGGQIWDQSGDEDKQEGISYQGQQDGKKIYWNEGGKDETLCLYDRQYWDDELNRQLAQFKPGVRILMVADCCHAASNFRDLDEDESDDLPPPPRTLGLDKSMQVIEMNQTVYWQEWKGTHDFMKEQTSKIPAALIQLAACKEAELSGDSFPKDPNPQGVFTRRLVQVWNNGQFKGTYQQMLDAVNKLIPDTWNQTPQLVSGGESDPVFLQQKPFVI